MRYWCHRTARSRRLSSCHPAGRCKGRSRSLVNGRWQSVFERLMTGDQRLVLVMSFKDYFNSLKSSEHRLAWLVAMAADVVQIVGFPIFVEGAVSPADSVLGLV